MEKIILIILIVGIIGLVSVIISGELFTPPHSFIIEPSGRNWQVIYTTDSDYEVYIADKNTQQTEVCLLHKNATSPSELEPHMNLYDSNNTLIIQLNRAQKNEKYGFCRLVDTEEYMKFGENSTIVEYQEISTVQYIYDEFEINATLEECNDSRENCGINYPEVLIIDTDALKFGAERYNATDDLEFRYVYESNKSILHDSFGYYLEGQITYSWIPKVRRVEKHYINTGDICYVNYNESNSSVIDFDSNCVYNLSSDNLRLEVYFTGEYTGSPTMFIDPSYTISTFSTSESTDTNITQENNFSHLEISDNAPYDSLVLYMPFDVNSSNYNNITYDYSKEDNDGTMTNDAKFTASGKYGGGIYVDGIADYVNVPDDSSLDPINKITVSMWIKADTGSLQDYRVPLMKTSSSAWVVGYGFYFLSNNIHFFIDSWNGNTAYTSITDNTWYHFVGVYNGTTVSIYKNGVKGTDDSYTGTISDVAKPLTIGWDGYTSAYSYKGKIDEIMIFNTSLTQAQIQDIYNNQSARFKNQGTQTFRPFNITAGNDNVNVTTEFQRFFGSNLSLRIGEWDITQGYNDSIDGSSDDNLVLYMHFDNQSDIGENDTHVFDWSGNGNNGTCTGSPAWENNGYFDGSFDFDGVNNEIQVANDDSINFTSENFSIAFWGYFNGATMSVIDKGTYNQDGYVIFISTNTMYMRTYQSGALQNTYSSSTTPTGTWNHYSIVRKNTTYFSIYRDGVDVTQYHGTHINPTAGTKDLYIGGSSSNLNGSLDEVMVWNRSLTEDEIKELYVKGRANWDYTDWQNITGGESGTENNNFTISTNSTDFLPEYKFYPGHNDTNPFYSPVLFSGMSFDFYSFDFYNIAPKVTINSPTATTYSTALIEFNVTLDKNGTCLYSTDGGISNITMNTSDNQNFYNSSNFTDATFTVNFYCNDTAGNNNNTEFVVFLVDAVPRAGLSTGAAGVAAELPIDDEVEMVEVPEKEPLFGLKGLILKIGERFSRKYPLFGFIFFAIIIITGVLLYTRYYEWTYERTIGKVKEKIKKKEKPKKFKPVTDL